METAFLAAFTELQVVIISVDSELVLQNQRFIFFNNFPPVQKFCIYFQEACFFVCGENLSIKGLTYLTNSLFDCSPENNGTRAEFILDAATHKVRACIFELNSRLCWGGILVLAMFLSQ